MSGRENAFDKLVNILLCKLVDEATNPDDLKFTWKGVAYDTHFDLLDRLQQLYQAGMQKFLGEDITYINEQDVNRALRFIRTNPDATQRAVWDLFIQQKFFTNNDFSFIDVHNQQLFYQNAEVLLQILQMWQDVRLTSDGATFNQFLGDMFEGFLDQGVKQSEGQFFTPIPLTRFIIQSLPMVGLVTASNEPPKVVDYACGAGHFLNEYANQAAQILRSETTSASELARYHENVFGIEKEYRLSKVAKVSAFMYGQPAINIVYGDALVQDHPSFPAVANGTFDLLVANPPYSVRGFLETLPFEDRKAYELTKTIDEKALDTANRIEAFFVERAKQLLRPGGLAAIVLPSSILSNNDKPTARAREILLESFDIVALVELGSGAFGSTGTTTVTAFLRRKEGQPDTAVHLRDRIAAWYEDPDATDVYQDEGVIDDYAEHIKQDPAEYREFVAGGLPATLEASELFQNYKRAFEADTKVKNRLKSRAFLRLSTEEAQRETEELFRNFAVAIEREKLFFFAVARSQPNPVLIIRSPSATKEMKRFFGYGWSKAKGNEGIQLITDAQNRHITPLYDETSRTNPSKISTYISANFDGTLAALPDALKKFGTVAPLEDLIDFDESVFDKSISLAPKSERFVPESKFPLVPLRELAANINRGASPRPIDDFITEDPDGVPWVKIGDVPRGAKYVTQTAERITAEGAKQSRAVKKGDFILSNSMSAGRPYIMDINGCVHDGWLILSDLDSSVSKDYLYYVLSDQIVQRQFDDRSKGPIVKNLNIGRVKSVLIPRADDVTQKLLVKEANALEDDISKIQDNILKLNQELIAEVAKAAALPSTRLDTVAENILVTVNPREESEAVRYVGLESIQAHTGEMSDVAGSEIDDPQSSKRRFEANDVLYGKLRPGLNKVVQVDSPGICSTDILVFRFTSVEASTFYSLYLRTPAFNSQVVRTITNTMPRTSWDKMRRLPVPKLSEEQLGEWLTKVRGHRRDIAKLETELSKLITSKSALVSKFL